MHRADLEEQAKLELQLLRTRLSRLTDTQLATLVTLLRNVQPEGKGSSPR